MLIGLDPSKGERVKEISRDILRNTVGSRQLPINIYAIAEHYGFAENLQDAEDLPSHRQQQRLFSMATDIIDREYTRQYHDILEQVYCLAGARFLLMPENGFQKNLLQRDYDLFGLKDIYSNVSLENIAYHMPDVEVCGVQKWQDGKWGKVSLNDGMDRYYVNISRNDLENFIKEIPQASKGTATRVFNKVTLARGWRIWEKGVMLLFLRNDVAVCVPP